MASQLAASPTYALQPSAEQFAMASNYISDFDFTRTELPELYEREFGRYGNRSINALLKITEGGETPFASDLIKWTEEGRLFTKYINVTSGAAAAADTATLTINDTLNPGTGSINLRAGQTFVLSANNGAGSNKGRITSVNTSAKTILVAYYEAGGQVEGAGVASTLFVYGSEFQKGADGMQGTITSQVDIFENSPIILKDRFEVNGSDMAQIGWVYVEPADGTPGGYLWYLKSKGDTRKRFDEYLETSMLEAVPAEAASGAIGLGYKGSDGVFYVVQNRGNVWSGGTPETLADWDTVLGRMDCQGAIEENAVMCNRDFSLDIDDMLAAQNSYGTGGTSYGMFKNGKDMALTLGFTGFRRGSYDFYKSDWKYLNEITLRGGLPTGAASGRINGLMIPAGTKNVYDQVMAQNVKRPFLHIRYRKSAQEDRKYKSWVTGSAGGAHTSSIDAMYVDFLSERCICTLGANNFMIFQE
jgi:hypothetical protein